MIIKILLNEMFAELNFRKSKYKIKEENIKKLCNKLAMHKTEFFNKINFEMKLLLELF